MIDAPANTAGPSQALLAEAAREYRAGMKQPQNAELPAGPIADDARVGFLFDCLWEATRHAIAAKVALVAEDYDLTHECLGALVADVKTVAAMWNRLRCNREARRS